MLLHRRGVWRIVSLKSPVILLKNTLVCFALALRNSRGALLWPAGLRREDNRDPFNPNLDQATAQAFISPVQHLMRHQDSIRRHTSPGNVPVQEREGLGWVTGIRFLRKPALEIYW